MAEVFPRRNLGAAEYWGRTVENRIVGAEKKWEIQGQSLSGQDRSASSLSEELSSKIATLQDAIDGIPYVSSASSSASNFSLASGWTTVTSLTLPTDNRPLRNVIAYGNVNVRDSGSGGGTGEFVWPFSTSLITSEYGPRDGGFHEGTDFAGGAASDGNNIPASGAGTVVTAATGHPGFGNYVILSHGNHGAFDLYTLYAHMKFSPAVSGGASVSQGQTLGQVGNTGASFGSHLHFETHMVPAGGSIVWDNNNPSYGSDRTAVDARDFIALYGDDAPATYDLGIVSRIVIQGTVSRLFLPYRNTFTPPLLPNSFFPVFGRTFTGSGDVSVSLQVSTTSGLPSSAANLAILSAQGIYT